MAALEAMLALNHLASEFVEVELLSPDSEFVYVPLSVVEPFQQAETPSFDLDDITRELRVQQVRDTLTAVDCDRQTIRTGSGDERHYDALIIAIGAKASPAVDGALTFRGPHDRDAVGRLIAEVEQSRVNSVAFVVPSGTVWPLPLYELALMTSERLAALGLTDTQLSLVTSEQAPLRLFGRKASDEVAALLASRRIDLRTSSHSAGVKDGVLLLVPGVSVAAERVIAAPRLTGHRLPGIAQDPNGFLRIDGYGLVEQTSDVYAAGDVTSFPIKQGGIAAQQADAASETIANRFGAAITPQPFRPVLRGLLLTEAGPRYLRTEVAGGVGDVAGFSKQPLWWPPGKIAGRYLSPYLARKGLDTAGSMIAT